VSGYIGGDIVSDIYISGLHEEDELSVLIDIGTNGEIVMCEHGKLVACSAAAGPAFEGYGLYHGCRAAEGAIEKIGFDPGNGIRAEVIGQGKATGVCGTGVIDFIAEGLRIGLINKMGRFDDELLRELRLDYEIRDNEKVIKACIVTGEKNSAIRGPVVISEMDISKILQAKAAIHAGLKILLEIHEKRWQDIKKLVLAGGFAKRIDPHNAAAIGLIPPVPPERIEVIGNGSLGGAFLALTESGVIDAMSAISSGIDVIELNTHESFQQIYIDSLFLPGRNGGDLIPDF
jgi:uncharacterized 2Fe-2S/4Fe-4S cluster protein (DUF4445 family)